MHIIVGQPVSLHFHTSAQCSLKLYEFDLFWYCYVDDVEMMWMLKQIGWAGSIDHILH